MALYNGERMRELLADFYNLTGMKICINDRDRNEICYYPEQLSHFCACIHTDSEMATKCTECDRKAFDIVDKTRSRYSYICHAGLLECVSPIMSADKIVGYLSIGQMREEGGAAFDDLCSAYPEDLIPALRGAFDELPIFNIGKIRSAIRILDVCAGYELLRSMVGTGTSPIDVKIDAYIGKNLEKDLSVGLLSRTFRLSHNEIYSIFKEYFGATPAEHVRNRRLRAACKLLALTDLKVTEISKRVGIADYNYFSKLFRSEYGISPREYRKIKRDKNGLEVEK